VRDAAPHWRKGRGILATSAGASARDLDIVIRDVLAEPAALDRLRRSRTSTAAATPATLPAFFGRRPADLRYSEKPSTDKMIRAALQGPPAAARRQRGRGPELRPAGGVDLQGRAAPPRKTSS